jgi:hypothetical protein
MREKVPVNEICWVLCFVIVLCTSCNGQGFHLENNANRNGTADSQTSFYLDSNHPTIVQRIEAGDRLQEACKFVQVEVAEVQNPKRYSLSFKVYYQPNNNENIYLGSFSLYPADNPGRFIVATQGKLRNEGAIVLSMVIPDDFNRRDALRAGVKRIKCSN